MTHVDGTAPEQAPIEKRPRKLLAETQIFLATPETLAEGLAFVRAQWAVAEDPARQERGLYAWTSGRARTEATRSGVLYIGIANGEGGLKQRTGYEESGRGGEHAHGTAIERNDARVVAGPVTYEDADLSWVQALIEAKELAPRAEKIIADWCADRTLPAVEEVAIRLAIHLGDTGAPVNSSHAGSWANDRPGDWVAFAIAQLLTATAA